MALPFKPAAGGVTVGGTVSGATQGSVLFAGTSGVLAQDNAQWFTRTVVGISGERVLRIGPDPTALNGSYPNFPGLAVVSDINDVEILMTGSASVGSPMFQTETFRGTIAARTDVVSGDWLYGHYSDGFIDGAFRPTAGFDVFVDATPGATFVPGRVVWYTTDTAGTFRERLRITSAGTTALATPQSGTSIAMVGPFEIQGTSERWVGSTSGVLTHAWPATITSHTLTWPAANVPGALRNDGAGALSWAAPVTISDVTSARALDTTYANAYSNKAVLVFATVKCSTTGLGGSATATPKASTSSPPTVAMGGTVGLASGLLNEVNSFQICFPVSAGSAMNYRIDSTSGNGTVSLTAWFEVTL